MNPENLACSCCGERPGVDEHGCCGPCHWWFQAEVISGLAKLGAYLAAHAAFDAWCARTGVPV